MISDITIGQYFPGKSFIHKLDPRIKIILTIAYIVTLFLVKEFIGFAISIVSRFLGKASDWQFLCPFEFSR